MVMVSKDKKVYKNKVTELEYKGNSLIYPNGSSIMGNQFKNEFDYVKFIAGKGPKLVLVGGGERKVETPLKLAGYLNPSDDIDIAAKESDVNYILNNHKSGTFRMIDNTKTVCEGLSSYKEVIYYSLFSVIKDTEVPDRDKYIDIFTRNIGPIPVYENMFNDAINAKISYESSSGKESIKVKLQPPEYSIATSLNPLVYKDKRAIPEIVSLYMLFSKDFIDFDSVLQGAMKLLKASEKLVADKISVYSNNYNPPEDIDMARYTNYSDNINKISSKLGNNRNKVRRILRKGDVEMEKFDEFYETLSNAFKDY
ncbi:hypothetical protein [Candidatus Mancarchaeum acidiphilum]|nr:hypothetical protein [Candidatus Mancarchaeum acidiphilum]